MNCRETLRRQDGPTKQTDRRTVLFVSLDDGGSSSRFRAVTLYLLRLISVGDRRPLSLMLSLNAYLPKWGHPSLSCKTHKSTQLSGCTRLWWPETLGCTLAVMRKPRPLVRECSYDVSKLLFTCGRSNNLGCAKAGP